MYKHVNKTMQYYCYRHADKRKETAKYVLTWNDIFAGNAYTTKCEYKFH